MSLMLPCISVPRGNSSHPNSSNFGSGLGGHSERKQMSSEFGVNSKRSMTSSGITFPYREMEFMSAALPLKNCEVNYKLCQGRADPVRPHRAP